VAAAGVALALTGLSACGADGDSSNADSGDARSVEVTAKEYSFNGDPGTIAAGDTIEFVLSNDGQLDHSMEVLSSEGRSLGKIERISPGATGNVTVTFEDEGQYRLICDIDDHLSRGQSATLTVAAS
jgi:plastocyanin